MWNHIQPHELSQYMEWCRLALIFDSEGMTPAALLCQTEFF